MNCIFCKILKGELPSSRVFENERVVAFLDIHPVSAGHTLVVPRAHVESFTDLAPEDASALVQAGQLIASHLKKTIDKCEGISVALADGPSAGQEVPHVHLHLIPRREGDGFGWKFPPTYSNQPTERAALEAVAASVRQSLDGSAENK